MKQSDAKLCVKTLISGLLILQATACSSMPWHQESAKNIAPTGPTVLNAHADPGTFELNNQLQPIQNNQVLADVKDFNSKVVEVKLNFTQIPLSVPMKNIGGTTWAAQLSPDQLKSLAVSGKTMKYEGTVVAKDEAGKSATSKGTVAIWVDTPEIKQSG